MATIPPVVRHMILCDEVTSDPTTERINLLGLVTSIESRAASPFPLRYPQLCAYLQMTNGRGSGVVQLLIRLADSEWLVSGSSPHRVRFPNDPLLVHGMVLRLLNCPFPQPGLYIVEVRFEGQVIANEPLLVR